MQELPVPTVSAGNTDAGTADSYGYGFDAVSQLWYPTIYIEGEAVRGRACQTEEEAQAAVVALYNEHHPEQTVATPAYESDASRLPSSRQVKEDEYTPTRNEQAAVSDPAPKITVDGKGKGAVEYALEPQLPGRGPRLTRGYCYSRSEAGVGRWVVDVSIPGTSGIAQRKHKSNVANEAAAAALAKKFFCELHRITEAQFQAEVQDFLARQASRNTSGSSGKRKRKSVAEQPAAASAAQPQADGVRGAASKRSRDGIVGKASPTRTPRKLAELGNRQALPRPVLPSTLQSSPGERDSRQLVQQLWSDNALSVLTHRHDRRPALRSTYVHGSAQFATLLGIGFDIKAAVAEIDSYMKLPDAGKRYFLGDKAMTGQYGQGKLAAHELGAWALLGELCGVVTTQAELLQSSGAGSAGRAWLLDQTAAGRTGWPSQLAIDCNTAGNLLAELVASANRDEANCILVELEDPATACPHIFAFTFRPLGRLVPLILLDAPPSCPRFHTAKLVPGHQFSQPHRLDQLASCAAHAKELLSPSHPEQPAHAEPLHPEPRTPRDADPIIEEGYMPQEHDISPQLLCTDTPQQLLNHKPDMLQRPQNESSHMPEQQLASIAQADADANAEKALVVLPPSPAAAAATGQQGGLVDHGSNGNSSATHEPGIQPGSGHTVMVVAAPASPTLAALSRQMQELGEKVVEETTCVRALEVMLQAKMKAALRRGSEDAVEHTNHELRAGGGAEHAQLKVDQRRQDLARIQKYARGLNGLVETL